MGLTVVGASKISNLQAQSGEKSLKFVPGASWPRSSQSPKKESKSTLLSYELFFPLEGPEKPPGGIPRKNGEKLLIRLPGPTPENGEKLQKNYKSCIFGAIFPLFWGTFPHFRGVGPGDKFVIFSPFFGDFRPGGSPKSAFWA